MKQITDATVFVGDYPFRGFADTSVAALKTLLQRYGITHAVLSSFHELFWENNFDAAQRFADEIKAVERGDDVTLSHFIAVNPTYPRQIEELPDIMQATGARGIRLFPNYHGYRLWDAPVRELLEVAAAHNWPVQIFRMIQDERMHWMLSVPPVAAEDFECFLATPPAAKVLLSGLGYADIARLRPRLLECENVAVDLSRLRGPVFAVEQLVQQLGAEKLVFGSLWPIQMVAPTLRQIEDARIEDDARAQILESNWQRFAANRATAKV